MVRVADLFPDKRRGRGYYRACLALHLDETWIYCCQKVPVCSNGGFRKWMAGPITDGTILYIPTSPCQGHIFQECQGNIFQARFLLLLNKTGMFLFFARTQVPIEIFKYVLPLGRKVKMRSFCRGTIRWEGAQKEMWCSTTSLPRVTKCLWFEFNLHTRFIRADANKALMGSVTTLLQDSGDWTARLFYDYELGENLKMYSSGSERFV